MSFCITGYVISTVYIASLNESRNRHVSITYKLIVTQFVLNMLKIYFQCLTFIFH